LTAEWAEAPSAEAVIARDEERMLTETDWSPEVDGSSQATVGELTKQFSSEQLAAAYLRLWREKHTAPEDLSNVHEAPKQREAFGPSVWFSLPGGYDAGAEPRRLLPMICKMGNLDRNDIGAIRVKDNESYIEIREAAVATLVEALDADMTLENGAPLTKMDKAPSLDRGPRPPRKDGKPPFKGKGGDRGGYKGKGDKPAYKGNDKKPHRGKGDTPPTDWNDDPAPRHKKPKPDGKFGGKPSGKPSGKYGDKPHGKPKGKPQASDDTIEAYKPRKPKGDKPPYKGKDGKPPYKGGKSGGDGGKPFGKSGGKPSGKPHRAKGNSDPSKRATPPKGGKGAPPPKGKPSSKKNRARAEASKQGGMGAPRKPRG